MVFGTRLECPRGVVVLPGKPTQSVGVHEPDVTGAERGEYCQVVRARRAELATKCVAPRHESSQRVGTRVSEFGDVRSHHRPTAICASIMLRLWLAESQPSSRESKSHPLEGRAEARLDVVTRGIGDREGAINRTKEHHGVGLEPPSRRLDVMHARRPCRLGNNRTSFVDREAHELVMRLE